MCGLVGVAGWIGVKEEKVFKNMLILDSLRGDDSTGIASVLSNNEVEVAKELGDPWNLFASPDYTKLFKYLSRCLIGHNRYATVGGVSRDTAHPFQFKHITGVHNGTLKSKYRLRDGHKFKVDSEALYNHMEEKGIDDLMENMEGAYSLVWWDKRTENLNFLRNKERPMWMTFSKDNKTLFWASEPWMITAACERNGIAIHKPIPSGEDSYYQYPIDNLGVIGKPRVRQCTSKVKSVFFQNGGWTTPNQTPANHHFGHRSTGSGISNVHAFKRKETIVATETTTNPQISIDKIKSYSGSKGVLLEVLSNNVDMHGGRYLGLMDGNFPRYPIRLYLNKRDRQHFPIGSNIVARIGAWFTKKGEGSFFKVSPKSYVFVEEADPNCLYDDGEGHMLNKKDWEGKYPLCEWCFDPLFAEDHGNRLTNAGGCVCGKCAMITDVRAEFNLKPVY